MTFAVNTYVYDAIVVGSGCAGFNAADSLYDMGAVNICLITEGIKKGTSRNTGSDKQTYYKLSLSSSGSDSVREMAQTLFDGLGMDGDIALVEAANSVRAFMKLVSIGVDFPTNEYGEYIGYKTDHDPRQRGTSVGPLTSKIMTEQLEKSVMAKGIEIHDKTTAIELISAQNQVYGLIALKQAGAEYEISLFQSKNIIWCTGGQSSCYYDSVYPVSQSGMSGVLLRNNVKGANLQEWQYGLASVKFRWNVSGTYQQVLPRYYSVDSEGVEREFLFDSHLSEKGVLERVFLKGYQWPFDVNKIGASSDIDMLVFHETEFLGRKVYMDFRKNPMHLDEDFKALSEEAFAYLKNSGALLGTPIERLEKMNPKAVELYGSHNIDLYKEPLEVKVCVQHHNGGIQVDMNWQTNLTGLYAAGEAAGTFGVYRPGGSALNSTQVGSLRAASHIAGRLQKKSQNINIDSLPDHEKLMEPLMKEKLTEVENLIAVIQQSLNSSIQDPNDCLSETKSLVKAVKPVFSAVYYQRMMSKVAAHNRSLQGMKELASEIEEAISGYFDRYDFSSGCSLITVFKDYDMLIMQRAVLSAMIESGEKLGSRGSGYVNCCCDMYNHSCNVGHDNRRPESGQGKSKQTSGQGKSKQTKNVRIVTGLNNGVFVSELADVKPIPDSNQWFETVWAEHLKR